MDVTPIHILLLLQVAMNVVSAFLVARILTRFSKSPWIRAFGIVVWTLNPYFLYETLNGLETSVALMFFALFFLLALRIEEGKKFGGYFFVGFIGSLMTLGRLDMGIFYFGAFGLWVLLRHGWRNGWKPVLLSAVGGFPIALWFVWNFVNFHMFLTSSSETEVMLNHALIIQDHGTSAIQTLKAIVYMTQYELNAFFARTGALAVLSGFIGAALLLFFQGRIELPRRARDVGAATALFGGFLLLFIANASIRWVGRSWYFVSIETFLAILVVVVCERLFEKHLPYKKLIGLGLVGVMFFSFYVDWSKNLEPQKNPYGGQIVLQQMALHLNTELPAGTLVGSFAPGIEGYFYNGHLVDLDGWINNSAAVAMQERQLWQYILNEKIGYISVYGPTLTYRYIGFFGIDNIMSHLALVDDLVQIQTYQVH